MKNKLNSIILLFAAIITANASLAEADNPPMLDQLIQLLGKSDSDAAFPSLKESGAITLYKETSSNELLNSILYKKSTETIYGGQGYLITIRSYTRYRKDSGKMTSDYPPAVVSVSLIVNDGSEESELFGTWKGNMPFALDLQIDPDGLIELIRQNHNYPDVDKENVSILRGKNKLHGRRYIGYGGPMEGNWNHPYAYTFEEGKLLLLHLFKEVKPVIIPPTKPVEKEEPAEPQPNTTEQKSR